LQKLQQNNTGNFSITDITTDTSFYVQATAGSCESNLTQVNVKVVDQSYFAIPTAFTPNGDGKNDVLRVKVIGYIELKYFRIFNRYGELIYETRRLNDGCKGSYMGLLQTNGAFVWMAEGKDIKGNVVTGKGTFVLIK
jgi:gliding motility-associated-like protein